MNKIELLKKLKALATDDRGNIHERDLAMTQLNKLMEKYGITEEDIGTEEMKRHNLYFKDEWEHKLISQLVYKICGNRPLYQQRNKRNWMWCEMTDTEFLQFEMEYPVYKSAFKKEFDIFYLAFVQKNRIFPPDSLVPPKETDDEQPSKYSRSDRIRAAMMAEGIEFTQVRRQLNEQNK